PPSLGIASLSIGDNGYSGPKQYLASPAGGRRRSLGGAGGSSAWTQASAALRSSGRTVCRLRMDHAPLGQSRGGLGTGDSWRQQPIRPTTGSGPVAPIHETNRAESPSV